MMRAHSIVVAALSFVAVAASPLLAQGPVAVGTYTATLQVSGPVTAATTMRIELTRAMSDADREKMQNALKHGGYPGFLAALRQAFTLGTATVADRSARIRWASERPTPQGRAIVLVTDQPLYFLGRQAVDAKAPAGYEIAVIQLDVDATGGKGVLAAAARVKAGGDQGVIVDDYGDQRIEIVKVVREKS